MITFDDSFENSASTCFVATEKKKIVAALSDLMFTVKIQEAAKRAGFESVFVKTGPDALRQARLGSTALLILDLNDRAYDALDTIKNLKSDPEASSVPLLGYVSHVQTDVRQAAENAGCDVVVARSVFVQRLPELLNELAGQNSL